jgi:hypothetical protein
MVLERWRQLRTNFGRVNGGFPESRSGLITSDFANQTVPSTTLASRDAIAKTPPFGEEICCLVVILGESRDSGLRLGLDARAESREIVACSRTNYGRNFRHVSESRSGQRMGDFPTSLCSERLALEPLSRRIVRENLTGRQGIGKTSRV